MKFRRFSYQDCPVQDDWQNFVYSLYNDEELFGAKAKEEAQSSISVPFLLPFLTI